MKISSKGRYGLAVLASMAKHNNDGKPITVISLAERLEISKIYLEQVFTLLKRSGFVISVKGSNGGYYLAKPPKDITAYDILHATESAIFEKAEQTVSKRDENLERAMENVFNKLDKTVKEVLSSVTLEDIVNDSGDAYMYYL